MSKLSYKNKVYLYRAGAYSYAVPPVATTLWSEGDWINYIDKCGVWKPNS